MRLACRYLSLGMNIVLPNAALFGLFIFSLIACHPSKKHFSGYTDTLYVYLSAPTMGYVSAKLVERGSLVKQYQKLYRLELSPDLEEAHFAFYSYQQAQHTYKDLVLPRRKPEILAIQKQILQTDSAIRRVDLHLQRLLKLQKKQFIDADTIDNQTQTLKELEFQKQQLQENLNLAELGAREEQIKAQSFYTKALYERWLEQHWNLKHKIIRAPDAGYVFDTFYSKGELVPAQKPIVVMVVPKNHYIEFFVSAADLKFLRKGQRIYYRFYNDKTNYEAKIDYIAATTEYMPPILYTTDYQQELVFRIRAKPSQVKNFPLGQPLDIWV